MEWFGSYLGAWLGAGGETPPGTITATLHGSGTLTGTLVGDSGVVVGITYWTGSAWVVKPIKYFDGAVWATKPIKRWNGSIWV